MSEDADQKDDILSPEATATLLRLLVTGERSRISSTAIDGRTVWIKRYDVEARTLAKWLHALLSRLAPIPALRSSRALGPQGMAEREIRKIRAFHAAGIAVPHILFRNERALVLSHVALDAQKELKRLVGRENAQHDALLVDAAQALGAAHQAGLCHGRPHPRDMFVTEGGLGFFDFEEEPEAVMPLLAAQARDVWLLFLQISSQAQESGTQDKALSAYLALAPVGVVEELRRIVRFFAPILPLLHFMKRVALGNDGRRVLKATEFLKDALDGKAASVAQEAEDEKWLKEKP